ncbi:MAG: hypothetical protein MZV63_66035 [Marinilabiliales bacterium]|nr:hypothetical protein [Marinilabiliales bacterium]
MDHARPRGRAPARPSLFRQSRSFDLAEAVPRRHRPDRPRRDGESPSRTLLFGGGAVRRVSDWSASASGWLVPKFQVGFRTGPTRLTLSGLYLNTSKDLILGLTIGIGIGRGGGGRDTED